MACNTAKRPFNSINNAGSTMGERDLSLERRMVGHDTSSVVNSVGGSSEASFCSDRTLFAADSVSTLDDPGYDPESLLLEPLLPSPRSTKERENRAGVVDVTSGTNVCENVLSDGHMTNHSSNTGEPVSLGVGWDQHNSTVASHHQHNQQSSSMPGLLGQPLVPVSPATSGAQATAPYIPGETRVPPPATAGSNSNGNGAWHLKLPSHAQHGTTAAAVAAAAANVAAAIQQASMQFTPNYPPMTQPMSLSMSVSMSANSSPVAAGASSGRTLAGVNCGNMATGTGGGAGDGSTGYSSEDSRRSWHLIGPQADGQVRSAGDVNTTGGTVGNCPGVGNSMGGGIASGGGVSSRSDEAVAHRPIFVTREERLPGAHSARNILQTRGETPWSVASMDEGQASKNMHDVLGISTYSRSGATAQGAEGDGATTVGATDSVQGWQHSVARRGVKRLHSQSGGTSSPIQASVSSGATDSLDKTSSLRGATGDVSAAAASAEDQSRVSSSSATIASSGLRIHTGAGGGSIPGKRIKVLGEEDGSQSWSNIPRGSGVGDGTGNGVVGERDGWGMGSDTSRTTAAITPEDLHRISPCQILDSTTPRRRFTRCMASASSSSFSGVGRNGSSMPHIKQDETTEEDEDSAGGGGESSPDWHERDESEEEGGKIGMKTKAPFKLDPGLWVVVERRAVCSAKQCAYRSEDDHRARRRHYHALCSHVHQNGERKGMRFQHHQLEKVQKHQRAHQVSAKQNSQRANVVKHRSPSGSPVPRSKRSSSAQGLREQSKAIKEANLEAHSPKDWTPELTKRLRDLVDELGPKWSVIAEKIPGKSATACMLHWRVGLNPNHMVKGSGTWTAEEDERLSKLVEVVGMKWSDLARHIPGRIAKQCRERYLNHLDPSLRKDIPWTEDEEALLMRLCFAKQNQWAEICRQLHGRSYNDVKNRFNLIQRRNKRASLNPGGQNKNSESSSAGRPPTVAPGAATKGDNNPKRGRNPNRACNGNSSADDSGNSCGSNNDMNGREGTCTIGVGEGCVRSTPDPEKPSKNLLAAYSSTFPVKGASNGTAANGTGSESVSSAGVSPVLDGSSSVAGCSDERLIAAATAATVSAAGGWNEAAAAVAAADAAAAVRGTFGKPLSSCGSTIISSTATPTSSGGAPNRSLVRSPSTPSSTLSSGRAPQRIDGGGHRRGGSMTGVSGAVTTSSGNSVSNGSSFSLMGDELGEFGLGEGELTGPGSGFAPGGYWHQMVKEEARAGRESDDDYVDGAGGGNSMPPTSSVLLHSPHLNDLMDMDVGEEGEGGVRLPPPPPLDGEEVTTVLDKQQRWGSARDAGTSDATGYTAPATTGATLNAMDVVSGDPSAAPAMS